MPTVTIAVGDSHISRGVPRNPFFDPVALATAERLKCDVQVTEDDLTLLNVTWKRPVLILRAPEEVRAAVVAVDNGERVKPFRFNLELPEWVPCVSSCSA